MDILNKIMDFLNEEAFKISTFSVLWWYVVAAAAALVVILLIVTIAVAVSKRKKKKAKLAQEKKELENSSLAKNDNNGELVSELKPQANAAQNNVVADKEQVVATPSQQPVAEIDIENIIVPEPKVESVQKPAEPAPVASVKPAPQPAPVQTTVVQQQAPVQKPVAPQPVQQAQPVAPANAVQAELAEKIQPVAVPVDYVEKPKAEPEQPIKVVPESKVTIVEPAPAPVQPAPAPVYKETTYVEPAPTPVYKETTYVEPAPVVKQQVVAPTRVERANDEAVATVAPRSLPKKTTKPTKKTANQIANEIEEKTGENPRKKSASDKPAVVGQNKLPKKAKSKLDDSNNEEELPLITTDPNVESFGKFVIVKNDDNAARPYHFRLLANNGQILFESESYKTKPKTNSITAFKKAATEDNFEIDMDKAGNWRFKLYNNSHAVIGVGESYSTKQGCENSVQSVIKFSESARYLEDQTE